MRQRKPGATGSSREQPTPPSPRKRGRQEKTLDGCGRRKAPGAGDRAQKRNWPAKTSGSQPQPSGKSFVPFHEEALQKITASGVTPQQVKTLRKYGLLACDNVTGFHEGRFGRGRISTLRRAIRHVKRTCEQGFYVEMDLDNLSGLNAKLGHTRANRVYAKVAAVIRKELGAVACDAVFFRHGGDEMSAFLIGTTEEAVRWALGAVRRRVAALARRWGLDGIPHPKHPGDAGRRGIGVHFGVCRLSAAHEKDPTAVFRQADTELERRKGGRGPSPCDGVLPLPPPEPSAGPSNPGRGAGCEGWR